MSLAAPSEAALQVDMRWCLSQARSRVCRPISQWVEDEVVLPNGPHAGERYRHHRHPVSRLWFAELDSGRWSRFAATGPTQCGKSLMAYVLPTLFHLFEMGEGVIIGLPDMNMAGDKWEQDFLPTINASRYASLLPTKGEGSRGGMVKRSITFQNGAVLRFMSAGGGDKKRAGYTSRVLAITEVDGLDESGETSREADKVEQLEARTRAYGRIGKRVFLECTVSLESGRIWQEYRQGSDSRIVRPCQHCGDYVAPERADLHGWQDAQTEEDAAANSSFHCPSCGEAWTEADRSEAAEHSVLLHRGQEITPGGLISGSIPATQTLGFRWSAIDNPFATMADLGAEEWKAKRAKDRESAERKQCQFVWAKPYLPPDVVLTELDAATVAERRSGLKRGILPTDCIGISVGVDTHKHFLRWQANAVKADGSQPIIEYGEQLVDCDKLGVYRGLIDALSKLKAYFDRGWCGRGPTQVWIDSGYHEHRDSVYAFCQLANQGLPDGSERYRPSKGYGEGQRNMTRYTEPKGLDHAIVHVGKQFYIARVLSNGRLVPGVQLVHVNSDVWKSEFHQRLKMPPGAPGCITLWDAADPADHGDYTTSITAERQVEKFIPPRGPVIVWETLSRQNHFLDTGYVACAAGHFIHSLASQPQQPATPPGQRPSLAQAARSAR